MKDEQEIDNLILSLVMARWQKTAMLISKALDHLEGGSSDDLADMVARRIEHLVRTGRLGSRGDLSRWRRSEIRHAGPSD